VFTTAMINHVFTSFSAVQIYDLSYIHLQSENQFTNMSDDTVSISIIIWKYTVCLQGKNLNLNLKLDLWKISVSFIHMHAILETPSNLPNKINLYRNKMFQLVFNLVWAPPLDTGQKWYWQVVVIQCNLFISISVSLIMDFWQGLLCITD